MPKNGGARGVGTAEGVRCREGSTPETLPEIGITHKQSSVWQRIAALAEDEFEERVADAKENGLEFRRSFPPRRRRVRRPRVSLTGLFAVGRAKGGRQRT